MFTARLYRPSRASLAVAVLLLAACLLLSVSQAQAQNRKARARTGKARVQTEKILPPASSLAEVTLKRKTKLLVILGTGEKIKGKADNIVISDGTLSIKKATNQFSFPRDFKIRAISESEIYQIYRVKGSRGRGALNGALIGAGFATIVLFRLGGDPGLIFIPLFAVSGAGIGSVIGALVSREKMGSLIYQNPAVAPPSGLNTGLLNFRAGRLSFAVPTTYLRPDNSYGFRVKPSKKNSKHLDLVRVDF